jgi:transposase InsO family protein
LTGITVHEAIDADLDARANNAVFERINPIAILQRSLDPHGILYPMGYTCQDGKFLPETLRRRCTTALRSTHGNLRSSSDGFEISCWDRGAVRVTFVIDTCDRELIAWAATTGGFDGETVHDLMLLSVERRFGTQRQRHLERNSHFCSRPSQDLDSDA